VSESSSGSAAAEGVSLWGLISLSVAPAVAYGLSRFAYALLLPPMKTDLGLTFTEAGSINTANNLGYLAGAVLAIALVRQSNAKRLFFFGIFATAVGLCATAPWRDLNALLAVRLVAGVPAAIASVAGGILATHAGGGNKLRSSLALNIYYCGGGLGIILSTIAALPILPVGSYAAWPLTWVLLGCLTIVCAVPALFTVRRIAMRPVNQNAPASIRRLAGMGSIGASYFCFGVGYIGYMTFVIAYLRGSDIGSYGIALFWVVVGIASSIGAFAWTPIFSRLSGAGAMAAVMATIGIGALLPIVSPTLPMTTLSAVLFGSSFLSVVAAVNYAIRGQLPAEQWAPAIATMTVIVSVGQSIGPIAAGWLSEGRGGLSTGLMISPICLLLGASLAALRAFSQRNSAQAKQAWS